MLVQVLQYKTVIKTPILCGHTPVTSLLVNANHTRPQGVFAEWVTYESSRVHDRRNTTPFMEPETSLRRSQNCDDTRHTVHPHQHFVFPYLDRKTTTASTTMSPKYCLYEFFYHCDLRTHHLPQPDLVRQPHH